MAKPTLGKKRGGGGRWIKEAKAGLTPGREASSPAKAVFEFSGAVSPHPLPILNSCSKQSGCARRQFPCFAARVEGRDNSLSVSREPSTPPHQPRPGSPGGGRDARRARLPRRQPEAGPGRSELSGVAPETKPGSASDSLPRGGGPGAQARGTGRGAHCVGRGAARGV